MRFGSIFILIWALCTFASAQDGSDMLYVKPDKLDKTYIGKLAHLDFGKRSFMVFDHGGRKRHRDFIVVELDGTKYTFWEHRVDDGFNNWFTNQYLETTETIGGFRLRWTKNEILEIQDDSIRVKSYFAYVDISGNAAPSKSLTKELVFKKSELAEVLIKAR
jgi:hypothetical protein